jgi:hypothetical protein
LINEIYSLLSKNKKCFDDIIGFFGFSKILNQYDSDYMIYDNRFNSESTSKLLSPHDVSNIFVDLKNIKLEKKFT